MSKENWRPGGNELEYGYGIDEKMNFPPVSIEDRTVVGPDDRV